MLSLDNFAIKNWLLTICSFQISWTVVISGLQLVSLPLARCLNSKPKIRMPLSWHFFLTQFMKYILLSII